MNIETEPSSSSFILGFSSEDYTDFLPRIERAVSDAEKLGRADVEKLVQDYFEDMSPYINPMCGNMNCSEWIDYWNQPEAREGYKKVVRAETNRISNRMDGKDVFVILEYSDDTLEGDFLRRRVMPAHSSTIMVIEGY